LSRVKDCNKIDILKNLIDCSEKPSILCVIDKTRQKNIPFILYHNKKFKTLIGTKNCVGLNFDFPVTKDSSTDEKNYFHLLESVKNYKSATSLLNILDSKKKQILIKVTFSPIDFVNDDKSVKYCIFTYENIDQADLSTFQSSFYKNNDDQNEDVKAESYVKLECMFNNEQFLGKIANLFDVKTNIQSAMKTIAQKLCEHLECDRVLIHDWNDELDNYTFIVEYNEHDAQKITGEDKKDILKKYISYNKSCCENLRNNSKSNEPYYFENVNKEKIQTKIKSIYKDLDIKSQIVMDFYLDDLVIGRIYIQQSQSRKWENDEINLINRLVKQLTFIINRWEMIEELRISNSKLTKKQRALEDSINNEKKISKIQADFVAIASHQFRTPMQIIQSSSELLERKIGKYDKELGEELNKFIVRINNACLRISSLITKTMTLAQFESGEKLKFIPEMFNLRDFIENIINAEINNNKKIELVLDLKDAPEEIFGDVEMLDHAIGNLIENSIKYSPSNSKIFITGGIKDNYFELEIVDQGIGIPEEDIKRIFTKFFRAKNTLEVSGTGIGLYLVKDLIEIYHKGKIKVRSKLNEGSTFCISLPITKSGV
jgi:signal transduction histidine kinase